MSLNHRTNFKLLILLLGLIPEALLESTLVPLFPFLVTHLLPSAQTGYYVGLLASGFYFPLFIMNFVWGAISDSYGRKPVLLSGMFICLITTMTLGLSNSFWLTLSCRVLAGIFGANSTVAKSFIGDLARDQKTRAWGYSLYGSVYGLSGLVGPLLGGLLANPADSYPNLFSKDGFFGRYPYALITGFISILSLASLIMTVIYLEEGSNHLEYEEVEEEIDPEIVPNSPSSLSLRPKINTSIDSSLEQATPLSPLGRELSIELPYTSPRASEFRFLTWNTLGPIFLYCTIAFTNMSYNTSLPLFYSSPTSKGGLGLSSQSTAFALSIIAFTKLFSQFFIFDKILGLTRSAKRTFCMGMGGYIPAHILIPFLALTFDSLRTIMTISIMATLGICESLGYLSVILMITESQNSVNLGKAHGLASTMAALARTLAPGLTGVMWEIGVGLGWSWFGFVLGGGVALLGFVSGSGA